MILNQWWANFIAQGSHSQVDFVCVPDYSDLYKKKLTNFYQCQKSPFSSQKRSDP